MYILIIGASQIGKKLVAGLTDHQHDVVLVDKNKEKCSDIYAETGAITINGDPTSLRVLEKAGVTKADALVACLDSDAENLAVCVIAKKFAVPRIITRMEDPEYNDVFSLAGVDGIVGYADLLYDSMMIQIEEPKVQHLTGLAGGKGELVLIRLSEESQIVGKKMATIARMKHFPKDVLFVAIIRNNALIIPKGDDKLQGGDEAIIMTTSENIPKINAFIG